MTPAAHLERADSHERVGRTLLDANHEWGAVCLFYAAYHRVKAALLEDPIFDSLDACQAKSAHLQPEDRSTSRHQGRRGGRTVIEWGMKDLVLLLYRGAAGSYDKLHMASIDVRYYSGTTATAADLLEVFEAFEEQRQEGALTSGVSGTPHDDALE